MCLGVEALRARAQISEARQCVFEKEREMKENRGTEQERENVIEDKFPLSHASHSSTADTVVCNYSAFYKADFKGEQPCCAFSFKA